MNLFDWFLIAIVAYSIVMAFLRGIILELFTLGGLITGILIASWNYYYVARYLERIIASPAAAQILAFLLIVVGIMILSTPRQGPQQYRSCYRPRLLRSSPRSGLRLRPGLSLQYRYPHGCRRLPATFHLGRKFPSISLFPCGGSCGILRCTSRSSAADPEWRRADQAQRARLDQAASVEAK